jgi:hypothetical protein
VLVQNAFSKVSVVFTDLLVMSCVFEFKDEPVTWVAVFENVACSMKRGFVQFNVM